MKNNHLNHGNKITHRLLKSTAIASITMSLLAACGQRGSLYLPTAPEAAQRSSIVETLSTPANGDTDKNNTSSTRSPMTPAATK
jgi:predicted small lipoprotein YifL